MINFKAFKTTKQKINFKFKQLQQTQQQQKQMNYM